MSKKQEEVKKFIERKLSKEVARKYKLSIITAGKFNFKNFGVIDLRTISLEKADALVAKGFPYLQLTDEAKKQIENTKQTAEEKIESATQDLKELDLSDIKTFDRNKGLSIISILKINTTNKKSETIFPALKEAQDALHPE